MDNTKNNALARLSTRDNCVRNSDGATPEKSKGRKRALRKEAYKLVKDRRPKPVTCMMCLGIM